MISGSNHPSITGQLLKVPVKLKEGGGDLVLAYARVVHTKITSCYSYLAECMGGVSPTMRHRLLRSEWCTKYSWV